MFSLPLLFRDMAPNPEKQVPLRGRRWMLICLLLLSAFGSSNRANAMASMLQFVEIDAAKVAELLPTLPGQYPDAHFFLAGLSGPSGEWNIIRVESKGACENDLCPTVLVNRKIEWKVLVVAKKQIESSASIARGEAIIFTLTSKNNSKVVLRIIDDDKVIFVSQ